KQIARRTLLGVIQVLAFEDHILDIGEFATVSEVRDHADDAHLGAVFNLRDAFADRVFVAEDFVSEPLIDHSRTPIRAIVLFAEPAATRQRQSCNPVVIIGHFVAAILKITPAESKAAEASAEREQRSVRAGGGFDLIELSQSKIELPHRLHLLRRMVIVGSLLHINPDVPDILVAEAERFAVVVRVVNGLRYHGKEHEEREEDFDRDQKIDAFAVPDDFDEMLDHRATPFKASTGCSRDIFNAG